MKLAALSKENGIIMEYGDNWEEIMAKLSAIGECSEDDFDFVVITNALASEVDRLGGNIEMRQLSNGIFDISANN